MLIIAAAIVSACLTLAEPPSDAAIAAAADKLAAEALAKPGAAALSIAVSRNGSVIFSKGYGLAEIEHEAKADGDTLFRIGSITKQFTAAAVMRLVEQGKLGLDDPINKFLPEYNTQGREITIRHLLTHTSGIKPYTELKRVMVDEPEHEFKHQELVDLFQNEPLAFNPGSTFAYNNSGYYLLGMILEKVTGKSYCELLQDEFFSPLGLAHTRCDSNTDIIKGRAQGYRLAGKKLINDQMLATGTPYAAGMLLASAHDLVVWSDALAAGKVVSEASYKQMSTPYQLADGSATNYGYGLAMDSVEGHARVQHGGGIFGFNSMLERFPDDGVTVAVISSSDNIPSARLSKALSRVALGLGEVAKAVPVPISEAETARCVGDYRLDGADMDVKISSRDGKVFAQATGQGEFEILYVGKGEFRASFDNEVKLVFNLDGDKPAPTFVLHQGGHTITANRK